MIVHQSANAVLVPASPTMRMEAFNHLWLVNHEVVSKESTGFFTPVAVQCTDDDLEVFLIPNRIQLASKRTTLQDGLPHCVERMQHFVDVAQAALPPMSFAGLNFSAGFVCADPAAIVRRLFLGNAAWPKPEAEVNDVQVTVTEALGAGKVTVRVASGLAGAGSPALVLDFNTELAIAEASQFTEFSRCADAFKTLCEEKMSFIERELRGG